MKIIKHNSRVRTLNQQQKKLITIVYSRYEGQGDVYLFETDNGHIARFETINANSVRSSMVRPLDKVELNFWSEFADNLRWFAASMGSVEMGI